MIMFNRNINKRQYESIITPGLEKDLNGTSNSRQNVNQNLAESVNIPSGGFFSLFKFNPRMFNLTPALTNSVQLPKVGMLLNQNPLPETKRQN